LNTGSTQHGAEKRTEVAQERGRKGREGGHNKKERGHAHRAHDLLTPGAHASKEGNGDGP
jgi:hypothetical protein